LKIVACTSCVWSFAVSGVNMYAAAPPDPPITLTVAAGRPLHIALDDRLRIRRVGQPVTGRVTEPVYAYDRIVIPAGTPVSGHVLRLAPPSRMARLRAAWSGDFSPHRRVVLQFDALLLANGMQMPIAAAVTGSLAHPVDNTAANPEQVDAEDARSARGLRAFPHRWAPVPSAVPGQRHALHGAALCAPCLRRCSRHAGSGPGQSSDAG
jgi:hypothetical protein